VTTDETIMVTGGSGIVGRALLRRLTSDNRRVRALARSNDARDRVAALGAEPVAGDVMDRPALVDAMGGATAVFHSAGVNAFCLRNSSEMFRVNVDGSVNVIRAAADAGVSRLVYTSSAATVGEEQGSVGREDTAHRGWFMSEYERSKYEAEQAVLEEAPRLGVDVVCVNPSSVQGPGRASGTGKVLVAYLRGRLRVFVDVRVSLIDIDDCAEGHVLAEKLGKPGRRYLLNGASLWTNDLLKIVNRMTGLRHSPRILPKRFATAGAITVESLSRLRGRTPPICREMVRTMLHGHHYDGSRATRELGLTYAPVERTIYRTVEWLVEEGLVPKPPKLEAA
jgi:dihydroflavonol-4-reductase